MSPGLALADHALDPVDELDRLDPAVEHREERPLAALVSCVLAGREGDVRRRPREPLTVCLAETCEDRDRTDLFGRDHRASLSARGLTLQG